jgi:hypothetical protein
MQRTQVQVELHAGWENGQRFVGILIPASHGQAAAVIPSPYRTSTVEPFARDDCVALRDCGVFWVAPTAKRGAGPWRLRKIKFFRFGVVCTVR